MPKVSVVIPLYQTERYIRQTIDSVLAQTFSDFEILVVDDGSSDAGPEIAKSTQDPRVRVIHQENRGLAGARNTGIRHATGDYIGFLDADDLWAPEKLAFHVRLLDADPTIGVSFSASAMMDDDGGDLGLVQRPKERHVELKEIFCRNPVGNGSAPVLRRAALDAIAFFDAALQHQCWFDESFRQSEDIECWTRIAARTAWQFGYVDKPLTRYRVSQEGLSANVEKQLATWRRFRAKVAQYAPEFELRFGDLAEAFQLRYIARRCIRSRQYRKALSLTWEAFKLQPQIVREEPVRTLTTLGAALAGCVLPDALFSRLSAYVINRTAHSTLVRI